MPRAIWIALLSVGALVILNAVAATLAHPDPAAVVAGKDLDPVTTAVVSLFGSWSTKPFAAVVLVAFLACGMAAQTLTARTIYSLARDDMLPGVALPAHGQPARRADRARSSRPPSWPASACCSACTRPRSGSLIAFGTAAIYVAFLLTSRWPR